MNFGLTPIWTRRRRPQAVGAAAATCKSTYSAAPTLRGSTVSLELEVHAVTPIIKYFQFV